MTDLATHPDIARPGIARPHITHPGIARPGIARPDIDHPDITHPGINEFSRNVAGKTSPAMLRSSVGRQCDGVLKRQ
jgi:hypothetical protein